MKIEIDVETDELVIASLKHDYKELTKIVDDLYYLAGTGELDKNQEKDLHQQLRFLKGVTLTLSYYMSEKQFEGFTGKKFDEL